jgi:hypothetical protein
MLQPTPSLSVQPQRNAKTTRLDVAAFLLVRGFQILLVDLSGNTATFIFEDPAARADSVVREFYNNGQVSTHRAAVALRERQRRALHQHIPAVAQLSTPFFRKQSTNCVDRSSRKAVMPVRGCQKRGMVRKVTGRLIRLPASLWQWGVRITHHGRW